MSWLEKLLPPKIQPTDPSERRTVPEGLWIKCPSCETVLYKTDLDQNLNVCPKCSHHHRIGARARLDAFLDPEGRYEIGQEVMPVDALKFKDSKKYPERLRDAMEATGETDDLDVYSHDGSRIDLYPLVRDQVVMAFPVQTLCREDCAGLCQACGANLNEQPCACQIESGDPRFAVLRQLKSSDGFDG